jgi:hypothetical protein
VSSKSKLSDAFTGVGAFPAATAELLLDPNSSLRIRARRTAHLGDGSARVTAESTAVAKVITMRFHNTKKISRFT